VIRWGALGSCRRLNFSGFQRIERLIHRSKTNNRKCTFIKKS